MHLVKKKTNQVSFRAWIKTFQAVLIEGPGSTLSKRRLERAKWHRMSSVGKDQSAPPHCSLQS